MSLATVYRPKNFDDVIGQQIIVEILKNQIESGKLSSSYLFNGPSGCGKTTIARIFSNLINGFKGHPIEVDGATNNGVDNVRQIIENARQRSLDSEYKVFIIDECHLVTAAGWGAFLKIIEEPIPYTKFIFCTTNPEKIPDTIITRVQQFNFTKVSSDQIKSRLSYIANAEGVTVTDDALTYIVDLANNGVRQAVANLEKCINYNSNITINTATEALGTGSYDDIGNFLVSVLTGDVEKAILLLNQLYQTGVNPNQFIYDTLMFVLKLNKSVLVSFSGILPDLEVINALKAYKDKFLPLLEFLSDLHESIKHDNNPLPLIEVSLFRWCVS